VWLDRPCRLFQIVEVASKDEPEAMQATTIGIPQVFRSRPAPPRILTSRATTLCVNTPTQYSSSSLSRFYVLHRKISSKLGLCTLSQLSSHLAKTRDMVNFSPSTRRLILHSTLAADLLRNLHTTSLTLEMMPLQLRQSVELNLFTLKFPMLNVSDNVLHYWLRCSINHLWYHVKILHCAQQYLGV
jgi:hypothetical protein